jgi:hypothetical protein
MVDLIILIFAVIGSLTIGTFAGAMILGGKIDIQIWSGNGDDEQ